MENKIFSTIFDWLKSTEMFARPSKQILGKWQLLEYYIETGDTLNHITEDQLKAGNQLWNIEFKEDKNYLHQCSLPVSIVSEIKDGNWNISKNYITFTSFENSENNLEFQFAINNEQLKVLKKDKKGSIEFFGFLNRMI